MLDDSVLIFSLVFLALAVLCVGIGIFFLIQSGQSKNALLTGRNSNKKDYQDNASEISAAVFNNVILKHLQLVDSWRKTNRLRDKMKILKIATNAKKAHA